MTWLPQGHLCLPADRLEGKKEISRQAEPCPFWAIPVTPSLASQLACRGSSSPCWPCSLDCSNSQWQSTAELKDASSCLTAPQNDCLREMFTSFEVSFCLGKCGVGSAPFTVHARVQVAFYCKLGGSDAE